MRGRTATLTRRGWSLLGATLGLLVAGRLLGTVELTTLGLCSGGLIVGAALWTRSRSVPISIRREIRPLPIHVGAEARVDLELRAHAPAPQTTLTDVFDDGRRAARFLAPALERGQRARAAYRIPTDRRGRFHVGPLVVGVGDPFGLAMRSFRVGAGEDLVVRPRVHDLRATPSAPARRRARVQQRALLPVPSPAHDEFLSLRDYQTGDDLRRVHWRTSARTGDLKVRDDESAWQPHATILLDNRAGSYRGGGYEEAIEALASIALRLRRTNRVCDVATTSGRPLGGAGIHRPDRLLDELAVIEPEVRGAPGDVPRGQQGLVVVVTGAPEDRVGFARLAAPGTTLVLVVCDDDQPTPTGGVRVVDGRPGALATSWNTVMATRRDTRRRGIA